MDGFRAVINYIFRMIGVSPFASIFTIAIIFISIFWWKMRHNSTNDSRIEIVSEEVSSEKVSSLIGVLLDVSGSMESNIGDGVHEEGGEWVRSLFRVIDSLITHDVSDSNHMFAIGMGANSSIKIFDVMRTIEHCQYDDSYLNSLSQTAIIDRVLTILENQGAIAVKKWAPTTVIKNVVLPKRMKRLLHYLESKPGFAKGVVNECLPNACKGIENNVPEQARFIPGTGYVLRAGESALSFMRPATKEDIREAVEKATYLLKNNFLTDAIKEVDGPLSLLTVKKASEILHGNIDEDHLTKDRVQELMDEVRPFIYGGSTPFYGSMEMALNLFSHPTYEYHKKILLVLSDGYPTDDISFKNELIAAFEETDVTIVTCFITRSTNIIEPKRLFSECDAYWEDGAKLLFELSSKISTDLLPRTIFVKRGWKIDITNNETKLFLQVNHPDILSDACDLVRNIVCCQDALAEALASVSLDIYINQSRYDFGAKEQEGGTCYANASAAVLHLSMKRILGRKGGYPDFDDLRQELIDQYGVEGANTFDVLKRVCPHYRLRCKGVDALGAMAAITAKRPVVAKFRLTNDEWSVFRKFFKLNPKGILTCKNLDVTKRLSNEETVGHAVVLTSYNSQCLRFMNSWGVNWGDDGFFRVQNSHVLGLEYIDVFWTEEYLTTKEKEYYAIQGAKKAAKFLKNLQGLQVLTYQCPCCWKSSKVTEFTGQVLSAKCPKCNREFKCDEPGNILALNMYLTSLSQ